MEGPGLAGQQGQVADHRDVRVERHDPQLFSPPLVVPARSPAATYSQTYNNIPAGSECTTQVSRGRQQRRRG